jgi:hypothetical protein
VGNKRVYKTPGTPRFKIDCPADDDDVIDAALQDRYRSAVGMLLYLTKYSRLDFCNAVRELEKCIDRATKGTYLEMLREVKFVIDTKNFCLRIQPEFKGENGFYDIDWAGDSETRVSVTKFYFVSHEYT